MKGRNPLPSIKEVLQRVNIATTYDNILGSQDGGKYRCPFHEDDKPSLSVHPATGYWKCFAPHCKGFSGGDLFELFRLLNPSPLPECLSLFENRYATNNLLSTNKVKGNDNFGKKLDVKEQHVKGVLIEYRKSLERTVDEQICEKIKSKYGITKETLNKYKRG